MEPSMHKRVGRVQNNFQKEENGQDIHRDAHVFHFSRQQFNDGKAQHSENNSVGNTVGKRHKNNGNKCRKAFADFAEIDIAHGAHHKQPDND